MDFHPDRLPITAETPWNFVIVTCMSFDLEVDDFEESLKHRYPELQGMNAWKIRNAGGRVTEDVIRSIIIATRILGSEYCFIIHHTCCGLYRTLNDEQISHLLAQSLGPCSILTQTCQDPNKRDTLGLARQMDFLPFTNLRKSVIEDMKILRHHPLITPDLQIFGYIYDDIGQQLYQIDDPIISQLRCSPGTNR